MVMIGARHLGRRLGYPLGVSPIVHEQGSITNVVTRAASSKLYCRVVKSVIPGRQDILHQIVGPANILKLSSRVRSRCIAISWEVAAA